jgi:hypothetical protein
LVVGILRLDGRWNAGCHSDERAHEIGGRIGVGRPDVRGKSRDARCGEACSCRDGEEASGVAHPQRDDADTGVFVLQAASVIDDPVAAIVNDIWLDTAERARARAREGRELGDTSDRLVAYPRNTRQRLWRIGASEAADRQGERGRGRLGDPRGLIERVARIVGEHVVAVLHGRRQEVDGVVAGAHRHDQAQVANQLVEALGQQAHMRAGVAIMLRDGEVEYAHPVFVVQSLNSALDGLMDGDVGREAAPVRPNGIGLHHPGLMNRAACDERCVVAQRRLEVAVGGEAGDHRAVCADRALAV